MRALGSATEGLKLLNHIVPYALYLTWLDLHIVFLLDKDIQTDARRNVEIPEVMKLTGHFSHSIYMYSIGLNP